MLSDEWLPRNRLLENFTAKWNGNGNAYDRGDYNSSFALRAIELKTTMIIPNDTFEYINPLNTFYRGDNYCHGISTNLHQVS